MTDSFFDQRRRELGLTGDSAAPPPSPNEDSFFTQRRMDLGLIKDTRRSSVPYGPPDLSTPPVNTMPNMDVTQSPLMKKIQQFEATNPQAEPQQPENNDERTDYPGGWFNPLNILGHIANSPIVNQFDYAAGKAMGIPDNMMTATPQSTGNVIADKAAGFLGSAAGYLTNPSQLEQNVGQTFFENPLIQRVAGAVGNKAQNLLPDAGLTVSRDGSQIIDSMLGKTVNRAAQNLTQGGLGSAAYAPFQTLIGGGNEQDIPKNMFEQGLQGAAFGGILGAVSPVVGDALQRLFAEKPAGAIAPSVFDEAFPARYKEIYPSSPSPYKEYQGYDQPPLGLPEPRSAQRIRDAQARSLLSPGTEPIYGQGEIYTPPPQPVLALPEGKYTPPTRLKIAGNDQTLNYVMQKIKPEVDQILTPPTRRDLLINYITEHLQVPKEEVWNMPMKDLQDLGHLTSQGLRQRLPEIATQAAQRHGYDLPALLERKAPTISQKGAQFAQQRTYGVYPESLPNVKKPQLNKEVLAEAAAPVQRMQRLKATVKQEQPAPKKIVNPAHEPIIASPEPSNAAVSARREPVIETPRFSNKAEIKPAETPIQGSRERGHSQTVRNSDMTPEALKQAMTEPELYKTRSTKKLHEDAQKFIEKNGQQGAYDFVMGAKKMTDKHNAVAQILSKQLANSGDISKAIDVVSKTAAHGTELGRAIQSLSLWNRMDTEGALLLAQRQLNKVNPAEMRTLTPEEAKPIIAATEKIKQVEQTKSLAQEVMDIVANKPAGEKLSDAEIAKIKEFQKEVNGINDKVKQFLPGEKAKKPQKVIEEIGKIKPKERTRDQVVNFLEAKAEKARQRLNASKHIGFAAVNKGNPVIDYAIIGAAHIANKIVTLSDFTEAMVRDFGEKVRPNIHEIYTKAVNIFRRENGLPTVQELDRVVKAAIKKGTFTEDEANRFKAWANEIAFMSDEFKLEATQDLQKAMNDIGHSSLGQMASTLQASAQLLSFPTLERNVIGNEAFNLLGKINKVAAVPLDWTLSKLTGERTIVFKTGNQEAYWKNFVKGLKAGWRGVSANGQFAAMDIHPEAFKSAKNPFQYLQKATGAMLQSFDHAAYMRAYGETLATYSKLSGKPINELDQSIFDLAEEAGKYATFQDETYLSKIAVGAKRLLNKPTDMLADALVNKGVLPERLSWKGFGVGDLVLKYAKTPANIIMRGIDFSPIGLMRGLGELMPLITRKEFNQRAAVMALSRGITGTLGLTMLGYALAKVGILTGSSSSDADIRSLDQQTGKGEYKVNWSALTRYIMGGLDENDAQWQPGDRIFDWGWLQPMAISIAMGVNAQESAAQQKAEGTKSPITTIRQGLIGSLKTIMQQPLLQGVQNLVTGATNVAKYNSWSGIANIFKGAPASFVPALSNQIRNFTDNTSRNTYDPNGWKQALNMVMNRIPGLDKNLPVAYNTLGSANEQIQGGQANTLSQGLKSFASPVKITQYTVSPEAKMVLDLINSTGKTTVAPHSPDKYLMVDKKKVNLTPEQYSEIQQKTGQEAAQALSKLSSMLANPNIKDDNKVKAVTDALTRVGKNVRAQMEKEYPELKSHPARR